MRRRTEYALAFALVLALTASVVGAGWAFDLDTPYTSTITYPGMGGSHIGTYSNQLTATVSRNPNGSYHYLYSLAFVHTYGTNRLSAFSVGRMAYQAFANQDCNETSLIVAASNNSVLWNSGSVLLGHTVTVSYDSFWSYGEVDVTATAGMPSGGKTVGMVPEPSSLLAVAFGLGGVLWTSLKRKSR